MSRGPAKRATKGSRLEKSQSGQQCLFRELGESGRPVIPLDAWTSCLRRSLRDSASSALASASVAPPTLRVPIAILVCSSNVFV